MVKVEEPSDLQKRAFALACEMFGEKNVKVVSVAGMIEIYPSSKLILV